MAKNKGLADITRRCDLASGVTVNALAPMTDFRPAYWQVDAIERKFIDGYVTDIQTIADKTGQRLAAALHAPFPYELGQRELAMLARPMVRAAISQRIDELSNTYDISIPRTLREWTVIAYSNIADYVKIDEFGCPEIDLSQIPREKMAAIKSFEIEDKPRGGRKYKFQLHDKLGALNSVARYQGLLADDNTHWRNQEASTKPNTVSKLPANVTDDAAASLYAREING